MRLNYPLGVVHVITNLLPGGVASQIFYLLKGLDRNKWQPAVVALTAADENAAPFAQHNIPVHVLDMKRISGIAGLIEGVVKIAQIAIATRPAVLHTHFDRAAYYGRVASRLAKIPVSVRTIHGAEEMTYRRRKRERRLQWFTDYYIAVSDYTRKHMAEQGFDLSKTLVIYNGVPEEKFYPDEHDRAEVRRELGIGENEVLVGCVSRLDPEKGVDCLVESASVALKHNNRLRFVVAGNGSEEAVLQTRVENLGIQNRFTLLGLRNDVPRLLRGFDIFVLPSRTEGLPIALVEAMMSGVPVIATPVGGTPEVITEESGILTKSTDPSDIADCILRLANEPTSRAKYAQAGRKRALTEFSSRTMVARTEELYLDTLSRKGITLSETENLQ